VNRKIGLSRVIDLSASAILPSGFGPTPKATLFPWTMSDFRVSHGWRSSGGSIVQSLPGAFPVAENIPGNEMPMSAISGRTSGRECPRKGRGRGEELDPLSLPSRLQTALDASTATTRRRFGCGTKADQRSSVLHIVCQNTAISKLVYDFVSASIARTKTAQLRSRNGRLALFRNFDASTGNPLPRPNTLLIDSEQLEAGDALDENFRGMASGRDRTLPPRPSSNAPADSMQAGDKHH